MSNHGHRGVLSFRIQISPLCSECPVPCPPQANSRHMPCASLHAAAPSQCLIISITVIILIIIILIIIIRLAIRIFDIHLPRTQRCDESDRFEHPQVPQKDTVEFVLTLTVFFFPARCVCVCQTMYTSKWLFKNGLSDEQPWASWSALFSDPDISALL